MPFVPLNMASFMNSVFILLLLFSTVIGSGVQGNQTMRLAASKNPLQGVPFYVDPRYSKRVLRSIRGAKKKEKRVLRRLVNMPTAFWLTTKRIVRSEVKRVLKNASKKKGRTLVTFMVYNLPNRDCAANVSAGKICCKYNTDGTCNYLDRSNRCEKGLREYKSQYIDLLAKRVQRFCSKVAMAFVIEPDSLPNLVTNTNNAKCSNPATQASYRLGVKYAVKKLKAACPKATIYVDAAHGGWLGWQANSKGFLREIKALGITSLIRGFALNVSNYQEMGTLCPKVGTCLPSSTTRGHRCCRRDACNLSKEYNAGFSLLNYAASLQKVAKNVLPGFDIHFVLDTARNGVADSRKSSCSNWCNVRGAGFGIRPTTKTAMPSMIDAYMWLKVPGESDGCTKRVPSGGKCVLFDKKCTSADSVGSRKGEPRAPSAGSWFEYYIRLLARNS